MRCLIIFLILLFGSTISYTDNPNSADQYLSNKNKKNSNSPKASSESADNYLAKTKGNLSDKIKEVEKIINNFEIKYKCYLPSGREYPNRFQLNILEHKALIFDHNDKLLTTAKFEKYAQPSLTRFYKQKDDTFMGAFIRFNTEKDIARYTEITNITIEDIKRSKNDIFSLIPKDYPLIITLKCQRQTR